MAVRRKPSKRSDHGLRLIAATARSDCVPKTGEVYGFSAVEKRRRENLEKSSLFQIVGLALPPIPREIARTPPSSDKRTAIAIREDGEEIIEKILLNQKC